MTKIKFAGGPGAVSDLPFLQAKAEGEHFLLPENPFRKEGFSFAGWHDGHAAYQPAESYIIPGLGILLTALWEAKPLS